VQPPKGRVHAEVDADIGRDDASHRGPDDVDGERWDGAGGAAVNPRRALYPSCGSVSVYDPSMRPMPRIDRDALLRFLAVAIPSLAAAMVAVGVLQDLFGGPNPSALYLLAVVTTAVVSGTWGAAVVSLASFLLYNFLFVEPRYTFTVANLGELINLFLLLFAGFVVGQLAARQRARAEDALARPRRCTRGSRFRRVVEPALASGVRRSEWRAA